MDYTKISMHGYSQEVRIPKAYRMDAKRVKLSRYGRGLLIEPVSDGFNDLFEALPLFSDDFMQGGRIPLPHQERGDIFQ